MIVYGTKVECDLPFPLQLPQESFHRYSCNLLAGPPDNLKKLITCGFPFYQAHGRHVYLYSDRIFDRSEGGQPWCYEVKDVVRFYWLGGERTIYYRLDKAGDARLLSFWFIHLVLPLYFTLEGMYDFLHAGAVEVEGRPLLFIAPSMGGKSTMTDYFIRQGHSLITDDKLATYIDNNRFMTVTSHPYHRPYRKFEELGYRVENFSTESKSIHGIYILAGCGPDEDILIEEVKGYMKFDTLLPNYLYMFSYLRAKRLAYLTSMLNSIRVFRVRVPWDKDRLAEVHAAITEHSKVTQ
ncbi:hypothetical protein [Desulfosediminicola sp.]|uniref:hypothetical protein n=1 Tax=Desulfosediminicola sp. TaxID=2886825 RepID=UPI003AF2DB5D